MDSAADISNGTISTHAPRTGSDALFLCTSPGNCAVFQPTLPARGATKSTRARGANVTAFQPTLPARGATSLRRRTPARRTRFQPTLPARGATSLFTIDRWLDLISTHAPRTGSDEIAPAVPPVGMDFNPRSPHGERLSSALPVAPSAYPFQPTLPARGATKALFADAVSASNFNPRSPHGERQLLQGSVRQPNRISTHAPRTGSDRHKVAVLGKRAISTHAPRTGSDPHMRYTCLKKD